jgi:hypothetical protein
MDFDFAPQMLHFVTGTNCPQGDKNKRRRSLRAFTGMGIRSYYSRMNSLLTSIAPSLLVQFKESLYKILFDTIPLGFTYQTALTLAPAYEPSALPLDRS